MNTNIILDAANMIDANALSFFECNTINGEFDHPDGKAQYLEEKALVRALHILRRDLHIASQKISAAAEHLDVLSSSILGTEFTVTDDDRRAAKQAVQDLYDIAGRLSWCDQ